VGSIPSTMYDGGILVGLYAHTRSNNTSGFQASSCKLSRIIRMTRRPITPLKLAVVVVTLTEENSMLTNRNPLHGQSLLRGSSSDRNVTPSMCSGLCDMMCVCRVER
jgi:hypothetical protein